MRTDKKEQKRVRSYPFFLTARFFAVFGIAGLVPIAVHFSFKPGIWVVLVVDALIVGLAVADYFLPPDPKKITASRPLQFPLAAYGSNQIELEFANHTGEPAIIRVTDDVPSFCMTRNLPIDALLPEGTEHRLSYFLHPLDRGEGEFGDTHFWVRGKLGLVWKRGTASTAAMVKLYPALSLMNERRLQIWRADTSDRSRVFWRKGAGMEFDSLREYVRGDDSRLIHWPTTARTGKPFVRQHRLERSQTVFLVLDAGRMMTSKVLGKTKMDLGLEAALIVSYAALEVGDKVGMMVVGRNVLTSVPPASGPTQFGRLLEATYAIRARMEEPRYYLALGHIATRMKRRCLVVIFTDLVDERSSHGLIRYSLGLRPRHLPLVVTMSDSEVVTLSDSVPDNEADLFRQGVACGLLERRASVLGKLSSAGVMTLDTPPEKITISAVERYLEVKSRNLL